MSATRPILPEMEWDTFLALAKVCGFKKDRGAWVYHGGKRHGQGWASVKPLIAEYATTLYSAKVIAHFMHVAEYSVSERKRQDADKILNWLAQGEVCDDRR